MKRFLILMTMIGLVVACSDDPQKEQTGFLEGYLNAHSNISVIRTVDSNIVFEGEMLTRRGYVFKPLKDILITDIGARVAKIGTYNIEIYLLPDDEDIYFVSGSYGFDPCIPQPGDHRLLLRPIDIVDTKKFQFTDTQIELAAGRRYLIRYFNESHNSVFDAGIGTGDNKVTFPLTIGDIEIETIYYTAETADHLHDVQTKTNFGILRGLLDFKYKTN